MSKRLSISPTQLIVATATYLLLVLNARFFRDFLAAAQPTTMHDWLFVGAVSALLLALYVLVITIFALPYLLKPVIVVLLLVTAGVSYFMHEYGVVIDVNMMRNTFETDRREAGDLMTMGFLISMAVYGLLPALIVALVPVNWAPVGSTVAANFGRGFVSIAVIAAVVAAFFGGFTSFMREQKPLLLTLAPSNVISATIKYLRSGGLHRPVVVQAIGADAHRGLHWQNSERPAVVVLVIGETARADRFSLNGYRRKTNPRLEEIADLINFKSASSCGTDTADSVPCIFSGLGRANFSHARANAREDLLDVVKRAGFDVLWRENQSGCKGACDRVPTETLTHEARAPFCSGEECHDDILVDQLADKVRAMKSGGLIVLHMMGSHGPAYYKRYPARFRIFSPTCETSQFSKCTDEEISNAYDNTILYSDHVLGNIIQTLESVSDTTDTVMLYASDHGESLGENGLYLHGMPYALAPKEQTHIPFMLWLSKSYARAFGVNESCLEARSGAPVSHDNIFPTVLGMLDIETSLRDSKQDLLASCRAKTAARVQPLELRIDGTSR